jgi:filamentous hemagglutinin family protein
VNGPICRWLGFGWIAASLLPAPAAAQHITIDGTLSPAQTLVGPNYAITPNLGKQVGGNLFQSFGIFGLNQGETATFSGPANVGNVIGRVTGGSQSSINGTINSMAMPGANVFLINPAGIVFGPNGSVNISGSFHASTADYLKMSDGAKFQATNPGGSTLSAAPPAAFGFVNASPGAITLNGTSLTVPATQTLGLVGGLVTVAGGTLQAPGGTVHVTAARGDGEVPINPRNTSAMTVKRFAQISISGNSALDVSDPTGVNNSGNVFINAGMLSLDASAINASNYGTGLGGSIIIKAASLTLSNGSFIGTDALNIGSGGVISINVVGQLSIDDSSIGSGSSPPCIFCKAGNGGNIFIQANDVSLTNNGQIGSRTFGPGNAGNIFILARDQLSLNFSTVFADTYLDASGNGGQIILGNYPLDDRSRLATSVARLPNGSRSN